MKQVFHGRSLTDDFDLSLVKYLNVYIILSMQGKSCMDLYSSAKQQQGLVVSLLQEVFLILLIFQSNPVSVF